MATEKESSGGIGFGGMLAIVFIVLKLTGFIDWSWWWITAPIWGGVFAWVGTIILLFAGFGLAGIFERRKARRWNARKRHL